MREHKPLRLHFHDLVATPKPFAIHVLSSLLIFLVIEGQLSQLPIHCMASFLGVTDVASQLLQLGHFTIKLIRLYDQGADGAVYTDIVSELFNGSPIAVVRNV